MARVGSLRNDLHFLTKPGEKGLSCVQANYILDLARHFDGGLLSDEAIAGRACSLLALIC